MFGVDTLKSYAEMTCDSLTPDFLSYISVRAYDFLVVTTSRKPKSSKRLRRGGAFVLSPCLTKSSRYPPQTWASSAAAVRSPQEATAAARPPWQLDGASFGRADGSGIRQADRLAGTSLCGRAGHLS